MSILGLYGLTKDINIDCNYLENELDKENSNKKQIIPEAEPNDDDLLQEKNLD